MCLHIFLFFFFESHTTKIRQPAVPHATQSYFSLSTRPPNCLCMPLSSVSLVIAAIDENDCCHIICKFTMRYDSREPSTAVMVINRNSTKLRKEPEKLSGGNLYSYARR